MQELRGGMAAVLDAAQGETGIGKLTTLSRQVRNTFNERLGGIDVFATEKPWFGGLLYTVIDKAGIAIMFHVGGTVQRMDQTSGDRIYYRIAGGAGRAFKFIAHEEAEPVDKSDFFGAGFPYRASAIALSKVSGGTVARVKGAVAATFSIDCMSRVTSDGITDMRIFHCGGDLFNKTQLLFEEAISGDPGEWERIFRLLNS